jgi:hypothetical protein
MGGYSAVVLRRLRRTNQTMAAAIPATSATVAAMMIAVQTGPMTAIITGSERQAPLVLPAHMCRYGRLIDANPAGAFSARMLELERPSWTPEHWEVHRD